MDLTSKSRPQFSLHKKAGFGDINFYVSEQALCIHAEETSEMAQVLPH